MFTLINLAVKNIVSRKSSFAIVLFISFSIALLVLSNSVFDSTEVGIEDVFKNSYTGDLVIRPKTKNQLSLFGDETPVTGRLTKIEMIPLYEEVKSIIQENKQIKDFLPQVTGIAEVETPEEDIYLYLFGVDSSHYLKLMPSIKLLEGSAFLSGEKGALLCKPVAEDLGVKIGDTIQFTVVDGPTFRIRAVPVTGIYEWKVENETMKQFCIIDSKTVRAVMNITETFSDAEIDENKTTLLQNLDSDFDDLFAEASDTEAVLEDVTVFSDSEKTEDVNENSSDWNFIIARTVNPEKASSTIRKLNKVFKNRGIDVEAVSWRQAAGRTAMYLYWMRIIFNAGILIILFAGFMVVNNALVINVLDRISEIGTMRAVGSSQAFIALLFMFETLFITISSGFIGSVLGSFFSSLVSAAQISFSNSFLIQLFGGTTLVTKITFNNIKNSFLLALFLGIIGWIYPLKTALKISPVSAMNGAK